jgi:acyl dehydratase
MTEMHRIRFDDIQALTRLIEEDYGPFGRPFQLSQGMVDAFGELTGDKQWIHSDVERARRESPFGTTIAHGFLVLSLLNVLDDAQSFEIVGHQSLVNYGADRLRFVRPVPVGSQIKRRSRLVHVRKKGPTGTQLTADNEIWVEGADGPAVFYQAVVLFL